MKKILIIGAGFLQDFVIRKAKSMGYKVLAVDGNAMAVGFLHADEYKQIDINDETACLEYAQSKNIDGVLTAATDFGVLTASYIAEKLGLPGLNLDVARTIKNKFLTRECLFKNCVDDTKQAYEVSDKTDLSVLSKKLNYPVMVKPCDGSGSRGASRVEKPEQLSDACDMAIAFSLSHKATVESFITGKEYGAESIVINGEPYVLAIMQKWMTNPPYYAELGHAIPSGLSLETEKKVINCVKNAIRALGVNSGSVNMDMLITTDGDIHIIDIGARMGGNLIGSHIIPLGTGIDYMAAMICLAVGDTVDLTSRAHTSVATRLLTFSCGTVRKLPDIRKIETDCNVIIEHHMSVGQCVNDYHTNLDGCGYIVATAKDKEIAVGNAEAALNRIRIEAF